MSNPLLRIITTGDGSHSLLREDLNETYHSFHGAWGESSYVFIEQCLDHYRQLTNANSISVFEVGLGTGLNALLSAIYAEQHAINVAFHTIEPFPVPREIYEQLNYGKQESDYALLQKIHNAEWERLVKISERFSIAKFQTTLEAFEVGDNFDCIYFDAFAPSKQAEVWSAENIQKCFDLTAPKGILSTYCAQGQFKRNLKAAGYEVETLKGAMGKKEMVRGIKH